MAGEDIPIHIFPIYIVRIHILPIHIVPKLAAPNTYMTTHDQKVAGAAAHDRDVTGAAGARGAARAEGAAERLPVTIATCQLTMWRMVSV